MIESFGVKRKDVAKWAGITSAVFSLSQCTTAILWGRASDKFGRKPSILIGLTCTMISSLIWGMSSTLPMAILSRALAGACNGNGKPPFSASRKLLTPVSGYYPDYGSGNGTGERTSAKGILNHASSLEPGFYLWSILWRILRQTSRQHAWAVRK
jgi:MFS family permease